MTANLTPRQRLFAALRLLRGPAIMVVSYLVLHAIFASMTEEGGLLSPGGSISIGVALLGFLMLLARIAALFVAPAVVAYRVAFALLHRGSVAPRS